MQTHSRDSNISADQKNLDAWDLPDTLTNKSPARLHYFWERQCDVNPHAIALICEQEKFTYGELEAQANQLANYFVQEGIATGSRVGILLERSVHTYVTLLGILKCGAAFVPLDPSFPEDRVSFIAENAALNLLVTTTKFRSFTASTNCQVLCLDSEKATIIADQPTRRIKISDRQDKLCYIIYTSGSTGRPKGVAVNHTSICNFLTVCTPIYGVTAQDRVYQGMIIAFDFSIEEIWPTFVVGATLIAGPTDHRRLGSELTDFLIQQRITVMYCVPTLLATIDRDIPSLRRLMVGGEACPQDLVKRWSSPQRRILNTYEPTETTVTAIWTELFPDQPVTIGKPLPTYSAYILDQDLQPVSEGESGEICIGGIGVAQGYINLPEQTAAKFVLNPFDANIPQRRLYRTGDLGRITTNGEIEYLGRIDSQVKIRGYRIELSEIEAVILENPDVENAIVALVSINPTLQELIAYITLRVPVSDPETLNHNLYVELRHRLPSYMVPLSIEILETIPILPNGKADRAKLPLPKARLQRQQNPKQLTAPVKLSPEESILAQIWQKLFSQPQISVNDNFFLDLGGHSLSAASLVSQLRTRTEFAHVSMLDVYQCPSIATLAARLQQKTVSTKAPATAQSCYRPSRKRYFISAIVQAVGLIVLMFCFALQWLLPYLTYTWTKEAEGNNFQAVVFAVIALSAIIPLMLGFSIIAKWLLLGQVAGKYPLWGNFYLRWWFIKNLLSITPSHFLSGTPWLNVYYRLLGAKIGTSVHLSAIGIDVPDLVSIGSHSSIGYSAKLVNSSIEKGWLTIGRIDIGDRCFVGASSVLSENTAMESDTYLEDLSMLPQQQRIPTGEIWAGSPAAKVATNDHQTTSVGGYDEPILLCSKGCY